MDMLKSNQDREGKEGRKIDMEWRAVSDLTCWDDVCCLLLVCGGERKIFQGEDGSKAKEKKSAGGQNQSKIKEETTVGMDER